MNDVHITNEHIEDNGEMAEKVRDMLNIPEGKFRGFVLIGVQEDEPFRNPVSGALEFAPYIVRSSSHDVELICHTLMAVASALTVGTFHGMSASDYREGKTDEGINISRPEG